MRGSRKNDPRINNKMLTEKVPIPQKKENGERFIRLLYLYSTFIEQGRKK
jgi:hypothetical protein